MSLSDLRFRYLADSFQRLYCLSVEQRYENFSYKQNPPPNPHAIGAPVRERSDRTNKTAGGTNSVRPRRTKHPPEAPTAALDARYGHRNCP